MNTKGPFNWRKEKILITGGTGLVGTSLTSRLQSLNLDICSVGHAKGANRYDLRNSSDTEKLFNDSTPRVVFHLAGKVGGIYANVIQKADFYLENTLINTNVIAEVQKRKIPFVFAMGTACAFPKRLEGQVMYEKDYLDGIPEATNNTYAYSKRNLLVHLQACSETFPIKYIYCISTNLYGPFDNFHPSHSHVIPGLIGRFIIAKEKNQAQVKIWSKGTAERDFLYVEDLIEAIILMCDKRKDNGSVNVASGTSTSITAMAKIIKRVSGYKGKIACDTNFPEGQRQRLLDTKRIRSLGWAPKHSLEEGIEKTVKWCVDNPKLWKIKT